jgi:DNA-binding CsgD family transcriptional regulator
MKQLERIALSAGADAGLEQLRDTMTEVVDVFGLSTFAYLSVPFGRRLDAEPVVIGNYAKDWTETYLANRFERIDPVIGTAMGRVLPFYWGAAGEVRPKTPEEARLFEAAADFGIRHGWTVPVHDVRGQVATLNFACSGDVDRFRGAIQHNLSELHLIAVHLHAAVSRLAPPNSPGIARPGLSRREIETLQWAARGKSRTDTAQIMGISPRTVKFHLERAMRKFDVATTRQAVLRAALAGTIEADT